MTLQKLYNYTRQCIQQFDLIQEGDRIAVGISGGKDSLTLLYALAGLRKFYPSHFEIIAVTADLGFGTFELSAIEKLCSDLEVEYHVIKTDISRILQEKVENMVIPSELENTTGGIVACEIPSSQMEAYYKGILEN